MSAQTQVPNRSRYFERATEEIPRPMVLCVTKLKQTEPLCSEQVGTEQFYGRNKRKLACHCSLCTCTQEASGVFIQSCCVYLDGSPLFLAFIKCSLNIGIWRYFQQKCRFTTGKQRFTDLVSTNSSICK